MAAARWREEIEEARSVAAGMHPKLAGLEDEELKKKEGEICGIAARQPELRTVGQNIQAYNESGRQSKHAED